MFDFIVNKCNELINPITEALFKAACWTKILTIDEETMRVSMR